MKNAIILFLSIVTFTASAQAGHSAGKHKAKHATHKTVKHVSAKKKISKAKLAEKKSKHAKTQHAKRAGIHSSRMPASYHGKAKKSHGSVKHKKNKKKKKHTHE